MFETQAMTLTRMTPLCYRGLLFAVGGLGAASLIQTISVRGAMHSAGVIQRFWRRRGPSSSTRALIEHFKRTGLSAELSMSDPEQFRLHLENPLVIRVTGRLIRRLIAITGGLAAVRDPVFRRLIEKQLGQRPRLLLSSYVALLHPRAMFERMGPLEKHVVNAASYLVRHLDSVVSRHGDGMRVKELAQHIPVYYGKYLEMRASWLRVQTQYHVERLKGAIFEIRLSMPRGRLTPAEVAEAQTLLATLNGKLLPFVGEDDFARFHAELDARMAAYQS